MMRFILPSIGCVFILLAVYHLAPAVKSSLKPDHYTKVKVNVRKRIGAVFLFVGIGLFGFYWFTL
jgi:hypothetical protein